MNTNKDLHAKMVSNVEVKKPESKPITSCSKPQNEQDKKKNVNVIARGMYRVIKIETQTPVAKSNMFYFNSTGVASYSSVRRPKSKNNNLKKRVLLHTKSKRTSKHVKKSQQGENLLIGSSDSNLYTISISEMAASSPVCLISKDTQTKSRLWHCQLSYLNFGTINHLTKQDLVDGISKFKYDKDHLCSVCGQGKSKKAILTRKLVPSTHSKLELIHIDDHVDESVQEDVVELDENTYINSFCTPMLEEAESSSTYQDSLNMDEFYQQHRSTNRWTKNHPIEQVIGDPLKPMMSRSRLHTDVEMFMYALTVSTTYPKNIKEAMLDHS
ncbi:retrovirus-related pol polyprotein from transposon TNT 1-94 [Tanacetum coccineum]